VACSNALSHSDEAIHIREYYEIKYISNVFEVFVETLGDSLPGVVEINAKLAATMASGAFPMAAGSKKKRPEWPVTNLPRLAQATYTPLAIMTPEICPETG
jgi:hypothetical protein